jgi:hypothetical protein
MYTAWWFEPKCDPDDQVLNLHGEYENDPALHSEWQSIPSNQFIYIVKKNSEFKKYIVTRGFGDATFIPLSTRPRIQTKLSWLTTTLMGDLIMPPVPGGDE